MKKLFSCLTLGSVLLTAAMASNAASLTREYAAGAGSGGNGTSQASICTNMSCTALTSLGYGSSVSKSGNADGFTITFDYSLYPGTPSMFSLGPSQVATINASPGTYFTFVSGCDYLYIKLMAPGQYSYYVYTTCL